MNMLPRTISRLSAQLRTTVTPLLSSQDNEQKQIRQLEVGGLSTRYPASPRSPKTTRSHKRANNGLTVGHSVLSIDPSSSILSASALAALKMAFIQKKKVGLLDMVDKEAVAHKEAREGDEAAQEIAQKLVQWSSSVEVVSSDEDSDYTPPTRGSRSRPTASAATTTTAATRRQTPSPTSSPCSSPPLSPRSSRHSPTLVAPRAAETRLEEISFRLPTTPQPSTLMMMDANHSSNSASSSSSSSLSQPDWAMFSLDSLQPALPSGSFDQHDSASYRSSSSSQMDDLDECASFASCTTAASTSKPELSLSLSLLPPTAPFLPINEEEQQQAAWNWAPVEPTMGMGMGMGMMLSSEEAEFALAQQQQEQEQEQQLVPLEDIDFARVSLVDQQQKVAVSELLVLQAASSSSMQMQL